MPPFRCVGSQHGSTMQKLAHVKCDKHVLSLTDALPLLPFLCSAMRRPQACAWAML